MSNDFKLPFELNKKTQEVYKVSGAKEVLERVALFREDILISFSFNKVVEAIERHNKLSSILVPDGESVQLRNELFRRIKQSSSDMSAFSEELAKIYVNYRATIAADAKAKKTFWSDLISKIFIVIITALLTHCFSSESFKSFWAKKIEVQAVDSSKVPENKSELPKAEQKEKKDR